jgi:hypothetical protein
MLYKGPMALVKVSPPGKLEGNKQSYWSAQGARNWGATFRWQPATIWDPQLGRSGGTGAANNHVSWEADPSPIGSQTRPPCNPDLRPWLQPGATLSSRPNSVVPGLQTHRTQMIRNMFCFKPPHFHSSAMPHM